MKTKEELNALSQELGRLREKLAELSEEELNQVSGGVDFGTLGNLNTVTPQTTFTGNENMGVNVLARPNNMLDGCP